MSANTTPRFTETGVLAKGQVTVANANLDGTGTLVTLVTGGVNGTLLELIRVKATVTTTAGMIRLFVDDGSNVRLIKEITVAAITIGASTAAYEAEYVPTGNMVLPATHILKASTEKAEAMNVFVQGGDY